VDLALTVPKLWRFGVTTLLLLPYFGASEWLHGAYAATSPRLAVAFSVVAKAVVVIALASIVGNLLTFVLAIFLAFVGFEALSRRLVRVPFALVPLTEALILAWATAMVYQFVS
jgi:hypothetical protein